MAPSLVARLRDVLFGRRPERSDVTRRWRVWDLDTELRYRPVVASLPAGDLPICEVGSGPQGLAAWTQRRVLGVDPGDDDRHGEPVTAPPNFERLSGDGAAIPLPDRAACAAVAVDTMEHVPPQHRRRVFDEMVRVTAPGGRVIIIGPTGAAAAGGDRRLLARHEALGRSTGPVVWLREHLDYGLPTEADFLAGLEHPRVSSVRTSGVFNLRLWWTMHRAALGDFWQPRGGHLIHHLLWAPFGSVARRLRRGPYYRTLVIAEISD